MADVVIRLQQFESAVDAARVADDISNRGEVSYVDNSGSTVNVQVGNVTVENA